MNAKFREILIKRIEEEREAAKHISQDELAEEICNIGFKCLMCGKCCRREFGDNRVAVVPDEIRRIQKGSDLTWKAIVEPLNIEANSLQDECYLQGESGMIDEDGNIHTFGWMLQRKNNGDCVFIPEEKKDSKCSIYELRPLLCSTYPFYMEELELRASECEGIGGEITKQDSKEIAGMLLKRYLGELQDTILTYKNYDGFIPAKIGNVIAKSNLKQGYLNYVVHNSEGTCKVTKNI
jgi:hypothetical protein